MFKLEKIAAVFLLLVSAMPAIGLADGGGARGAGDRERPFHWGRGGLRGNERSERPGNFAAGRLSYGGNGCPEGTMRVAFAPDNLSFSVLFDKFAANANSSDGGQLGAMSCVANLPITIPAGQQMEIVRVDYRGFVSVPQGGRGMLQSIFNFVEPGQGIWRDRDRINVRYHFQGALTQNYELSTGTMNGGQGLLRTEVSPCGGDAMLRIRNVVRVMAPRGEEAQLTVDSIDGSGNAVYFVNWRSCRNGAP